MGEWSGAVLVAGCAAAIAAAIAATILCLRVYIINRLRRLPAATQLPAVADEKLAPAELAYLVREGDMTHTLLVLSVDLVQRAVKAKTQPDGFTLKPYEKEVWGSVKDFARSWADEKVGSVIPIKAVRDPAAWLMRINAIRTFLGSTLRNFVRDFIKDPLHIRKYFSWSGIARLAVQLYTSTARERVEVALKAQLTANYLLIDISRRKRFALGLAALGAAALISFLLLCSLLLRSTQANPATLIVAAIMGFINAATIKTILWAPSLIPSYDEFLRVAAEISRTGKRMTAVRFILRGFRALAFILLSVLSILLLLLEMVVNMQLLKLPTADSFALIASMTLFGYVLIRIALDIHGLLTHEVLSKRALALVRDAHLRLESESPLSSLQTVFLTPEYDPKLSEIVAIYGIETLWLLS